MRAQQQAWALGFLLGVSACTAEPKHGESLDASVPAQQPPPRGEDQPPKNTPPRPGDAQAAPGDSSVAAESPRSPRSSDASVVEPDAGPTDAGLPEEAPTDDAAAPRRFVLFTGPAGFQTDRVFDSNREVVQFDALQQLMVRGSDGAAVTGWTSVGTDLTWDRLAVPFAVAFGSENGERRAYFTELATGTICDLRFTPPDMLRIFQTAEPPPQD